MTSQQSVETYSQDYLTYREIMADLLNPITPDKLDPDTLIRLTRSKLVYLENLRVKCFREINGTSDSGFTAADYELIIEAIRRSESHMRAAVKGAIKANLSRRKAS